MNLTHGEYTISSELLQELIGPLEGVNDLDGDDIYSSVGERKAECFSQITYLKEMALTYNRILSEELFRQQYLGDFND